jgi:hypothetical protein
MAHHRGGLRIGAEVLDEGAVDLQDVHRQPAQVVQ